MTLFEAVESGDISVVKAALATTTDVNQLGPDKRTPLIEAAGRGELEIVQLLLGAGAEPYWRDASDETALLRAAANGHLAVARLLAPHSNDEERALASSFLKAFGATQGPELPREEPGLKRKVAQVAARAAGFVGHDEPLERLERVERSETNAKKK
jgi:ankyrin repeat protein